MTIELQQIKDVNIIEGINLYMKGDLEAALETWLLSLIQADESSTSVLLPIITKILEDIAEELKATNPDKSLLVRRTLYEIAPDNLNNLIEIAFLVDQLDTFEAEILVDEIINTIQNENKQLDTSILSRLQSAINLIEKQKSSSLSNNCLLRIYYVHVFCKGYQFTTDWFSQNIPVWKKFLSQLAGRPELKALEVGSWQGASTCWLLDNILTHETSKIICVDSFTSTAELRAFADSNSISNAERIFDYNINKSGSSTKVTKLVGKSQEILRNLPLYQFDLIYIDGSHFVSDVLEDAVLSFRLLKLNGILIFDDYLWNYYEDQVSQKFAIDSFLTAFSTKIEVIHKGYQVICSKKFE